MTTSITTPTPEAFKQKAKTVRKLMKDKFDIQMTHSQCIELVSNVYGFKDWNTASASAKSISKNLDLPFEIRSVGDMRKALANYQDADAIDFEYNYKLKNMVDEINEMISDDADPDDVINQEFSIILERIDGRKVEPAFATFKLKIEDESITHHIPKEFPPNCGAYKIEDFEDPEI